jgi:hypothetical protein
VVVFLKKYCAIGSVADTGFYPGSEFFTSRIPDPGSRIRIKEFKYFNPQILFINTRKYDLGCSSRIRIPDPGVKKAPDPGSGSATLAIS